jgi:hypothetical protein
MTGRHISEDFNFQEDRCENLKSCEMSEFVTVFSLETKISIFI